MHFRIPNLWHARWVKVVVRYSSCFPLLCIVMSSIMAFRISCLVAPLIPHSSILHIASQRKLTACLGIVGPRWISYVLTDDRVHAVVEGVVPSWKQDEIGALGADRLYSAYMGPGRSLLRPLPLGGRCHVYASFPSSRYWGCLATVQVGFFDAHDVYLDGMGLYDLSDIMPSRKSNVRSKM